MTFNPHISIIIPYSYLVFKMNEAGSKLVKWELLLLREEQGLTHEAVRRTSDDVSFQSYIFRGIFFLLIFDPKRKIQLLDVSVSFSILKSVQSNAVTLGYSYGSHHWTVLLLTCLVLHLIIMYLMVYFLLFHTYSCKPRIEAS